tara:strand:- start:192 stop:500 length:309 start_codon:yes stop_codon:yes gene_type:complete
MSYRDARLEVDTKLGDGFISSMKDSQKQIRKIFTKEEKSKNGDSEDKKDEDKKDEESGEGSVDMRSGINMSGTSMGSYNKPMMKGSGLEMKCGSQVGKHMKR